MSLFDNNGADDEAAIDPPIARGMIWRIDQDAMTAEVVLEMPAPSSSFSGSQGNVQPLNNGAEGYMIGWGKQPWLSEFDAAGNLLYNVVFGPNTTQGIQSYRVFKQYWSVHPSHLSKVSRSKSLSHEM